jgi:DNA-binding CsgD family transcriptional regulator
MKNHAVQCLLMICAALFINSCKKPTINPIIQIPEIKIDTSSYTDVYLKYSNDSLSFPIKDSLYQRLIISLLDNEKFELLIGHLRYYNQIFKEYPKQLSYGNRLIAEIKEQYSEKDSAKFYFEKAIHFAQEANDTNLLLRAINGIGMNYSYRFSFATGNKYYLKAIELAKLSNNLEMENSIKVNLASNLLYIEKYDEVLSKVREALNYFESVKDSVAIGDMLTWIGVCYYRMNKLDSALYFGQKATRILEKKSEFALANATSTLGNVYLKLKQYDKALENYNVTLSILKKFNFPIEFNTSYLNSLSARFHLGFYDEAEKGFIEYLQKPNIKNLKEHQVFCYKEIIKLRLLKENKNELYDYFNKYIDLRDSLLSINNNRVIQDMNSLYETKQKESEINTLKLENEEQKKANRIYLIGLIVIVTLSISSASIYFKYTRKKEEFLKIQRALDAKNLAEAKVEIEITKKQIEDFKRIFLKNNLQDQKTKIPEESDSTLSKTEFTDRKILTEDDWIDFKHKLNQKFPQLVNKLNLTLKNLTTAEERLFYLMKLTFDSREIADMLGISLESVRKSRYRLKKKLGLNEKDSLEEWIEKF